MKIKIITIVLMGINLGLVAQVNDTNDKVGIGVTYPLEKLDVNGSVRIRNGSDSWRFVTNSGGSFSLKETGFSGALNIYKSGSLNVDLLNLLNGNVGIGTTSPSQKLEVKGSLLLKSDSYVSYTIERGNGAKSAFGISSNTHDGFLSSSGNLKFLTNNNGTTYTTSMLINSDGNVGIGTTNPSVWRLAVNGKIRAKEIKVETNWSDFVFENDYNLPTLKEVESHIKEKGHLKDIPSAKEVEKNGIYLGEMDSKLLQKIEELTLYTIQQQKEIERLKLIERRLEEIEKLLESKK